MYNRRSKPAKRIHDLRLEDVHVLLGEARSQVRMGLKGALSEAGLRHITDANSVKVLSDNIAQAMGPDIVICDTELPGEESIAQVVRKVRNKEIGRNPFLCIIAVTWTPVPKVVDEVLASGVDSLLAAPFSPQQIIDRIDAMVHKRKPFLVTSDYVGPDRRHDDDRRETTVPMMEAPNTLRSKALGKWDISQMRAFIEEASGEIRCQKIERQAGDVMNIVEQIISQSTMPGPDLTASHFDRLKEILAELEGHADELAMFHLCDLCQSATNLAENTRKRFGSRREKDLQLLHQTAMAIAGAAHPKRLRDKDLAHDIAKTVKYGR